MSRQKNQKLFSGTFKRKYRKNVERWLRRYAIFYLDRHINILKLDKQDFQLQH